jgi:ribosomal protein S1
MSQTNTYNIPKIQKNSVKTVLKNFKRIKTLKSKNLLIQGRTLKKIKGGFAIGFLGYIGFLPKSHLRKKNFNLFEWKQERLLLRKANFKLLGVKKFTNRRKETNINIVISIKSAQTLKPKYKNLARKPVFKNRKQLISFLNNR